MVHDAANALSPPSSLARACERAFRNRKTCSCLARVRDEREEKEGGCVAPKGRGKR